MAHGITCSDTMMSVRRVSWDGLGVVFDERPRTLDEALESSGLTWTVAKEPLCRADGRTVVGHHATVRADTDTVLGVVSDDYVVIQDRDCFAFLAGLLGSELVFETAGSLWGGRQVFITAALPDHVTVGATRSARTSSCRPGTPGSGAIRAMSTPVRAVCANTVRAALERARSVYRVRPSATRRAGARGARRARHDRRLLPRFAAFGDRLALAPMSERALRAVLAELYPHDTALGGRALANRERARDANRGACDPGGSAAAPARKQQRRSGSNAGARRG